MTRLKIKHTFSRPSCHGEPMHARYRRGKPGMFICRHCGNVRPQKVKGRSNPVYGKSLIEELIVPIQISKEDLEFVRSIQTNRQRILEANLIRGGR